MAPATSPMVPPPGITCAQLLRFCGRNRRPEENFGFSIQARRFRYSYDENPAANAYKTDKRFPGKCCSSFSTAGYGPMASHARRLPPLPVTGTSPADVNVKYDRFERADWSRGRVTRAFTGPLPRGNEWLAKEWIPSPDTYSPEASPMLKLKTPPVRFQFESCTHRDGDMPRLLRNARYPAPNQYVLPPPEHDKVPQGAESDFKKGFKRITWLDDPTRRGRSLPAPNQYSRCHTESSLLGGGRSINPEGVEPSSDKTPGPGEYEVSGHVVGPLPSFNMQPPSFLSSAAQHGDWKQPRGRLPGPASYDVPRLYGNAQLVFNWRERFKWI